MKQGSASRDKREGAFPGSPKSNPINPLWTSQIGQSYGNHITERKGMSPKDKVIEKMHQSRGFQAPSDQAREFFKSGSQKRS